MSETRQGMVTVAESGSGPYSQLVHRAGTSCPPTSQKRAEVTTSVRRRTNTY